MECDSSLRFQNDAYNIILSTSNAGVVGSNPAIRIAYIAQMVEHVECSVIDLYNDTYNSNKFKVECLNRDQNVAGSIPALATKIKNGEVIH